MSSTWTLPDDLTVPEPVPTFPTAGQPVPQHWSRCFGCGDQSPAGMSMSFTAGEGLDVWGRLEVATRHQGGPGVIHGGILSTAFDEALGMACRATVDGPVVTGHLEIDFARPIPLGSVLEFHARIDGTIRRKVYASAEARIVEGPNADPDVVVATSRGLFLTVTAAHFEKTKNFVDGVPGMPFGTSSI
ncbi:PaaI family thioesterase [Rhodococcus tibetensis]|uniref:Acyl-coenzyme A thioesterase THEM4 n=1 Tax=Rhodococcus tibetensis TaxID=2965064 RepID=A0ABT1Q5Q5_9NOCA|nr:PaaI family thioesterase [Rhodococcus sp. FXJ9.536]MCQ4117591.1 PaaI family thioesterase [Rhodococcus sp. FXJ9.536]